MRGKEKRDFHTVRSERRAGEVVEIDVEDHTGAIGVGGSSDVTANGGACSVGKDSPVGKAWGVVGGDGSVAELACLSESDGGEESGGNDRTLHLAYLDFGSCSDVVCRRRL